MEHGYIIAKAGLRPGRSVSHHERANLSTKEEFINSSLIDSSTWKLILDFYSTLFLKIYKACQTTHRGVPTLLV